MIATEPLPESFWNEVGWAGFETFTDGRHLYIYAMRTDDGRIALGGRGAPYHFGSKVRGRVRAGTAGAWRARRHPQRALPGRPRRARSPTRWGGSLGIPRDWFPSVGYDRERGYAWAGGYVGDGVAASNLAGRTLADLIREQKSELSALPWVGHRSRRWEPEPLRWIGVRTSLAVFASADRKERRTGRPSRRADLMHKLLPL